MTEYKCGVDPLFGRFTKKEMKRMTELYCVATDAPKPGDKAFGILIHGQPKKATYPTEDCWPGGQFG